MKSYNVQRIWRQVAAVLIAAGLLVSQTFAQGYAPPKIDKFRETYAAAMEDGDAEAIADAFSPDIRIMPEFQKTMAGPEEAARYYKAFFDRFDVQSFEKKSTETIDMGRLQIDIGSFKSRMALNSAGTVFVIEGAYFDVWTQTPQGPRLSAQAWNYDQPYDGLRRAVHFEELGNHEAFTASVPVTDDVSFDLAAFNAYSDAAMMRGQPESLYLVYGEDAIMAPHDAPLVKGRENIRDFLESYSGSWPPFHYVKSATHEIHEYEDLVLSRLSYTLRWDAGGGSGVSIGKGLRIMQRTPQGSLRVYRIISLHDH